MTVSYTVFRTHQNFNNFAAVVVEGLFLCWRTLRKAEHSVLPRRIKPVHSSSSKGEPHQERPACYSFPLQRWFVAIQILLTKHFRLFKLVHFVRKKLWWVIQLLFHFAFLVCCVYGMCTCWCGRVHVCADMGGVFHSPLVFWDDLPLNLHFTGLAGQGAPGTLLCPVPPCSGDRCAPGLLHRFWGVELRSSSLQDANGAIFSAPQVFETKL